MLAVHRTGCPSGEAHNGISAWTFTDAVRPVRSCGEKPPPRTVTLPESNLYVLGVRFSVVIVRVVDDREDRTDPAPAPQGDGCVVARTELAWKGWKAVVEHTPNVPVLTFHHHHIVPRLRLPATERDRHFLTGSGVGPSSSGIGACLLNCTRGPDRARRGGEGERP